MNGAARQTRAMSRHAGSLQALTREPCDVAIIGGGIYGAALLLQAAGRGLKTILVERGDFGCETSFNSLRILHGGLRYLQSLDIGRSVESIRERRWFMRTFPDLVRPLPCLLPLYDQGLRRPLALRIALGMDCMLSMNRNAGLEPDQHLPPGTVLGPSDTRELFAEVSQDGLTGGALWHDASVRDTQRLLMEILNWAIACGATAVNYVEAVGLRIEDNRVKGIVTEDRLTGERLEIASRVVINAAGPWCVGLAEKFDPAYRSSVYPSLAWNVLFNRNALSKCTLGVARREPGAQIYFLQPWKGRILAGTGHAPAVDVSRSRVTERHLAGMIGELNEAIPGLNLSTGDIRHVFSGYLPVRGRGSVSLTNRPIVHDHGLRGGPAGLVSVAGVKFGASRNVAERTIRGIAKRFFAPDPGKDSSPGERPPPREGWRISAADLAGLDGDARARLLRIVEAEAVVHLDDLALRRTTLWEDPVTLMQHAPVLASLFEWDPQTADKEISRLANAFESAGAGLD
jgi:glycerol-3-phosphate dehydrogenase